MLTSLVNFHAHRTSSVIVALFNSIPRAVTSSSQSIHRASLYTRPSVETRTVCTVVSIIISGINSILQYHMLRPSCPLASQMIREIGMACCIYVPACVRVALFVYILLNLTSDLHESKVASLRC